ncbi:MAG: hypothetical protein HQL95_07180 [Magnetococcales bacterium]|nr:hypothetical protein [Magnetococcales bacterium]
MHAFSQNGNRSCEMIPPGLHSKNLLDANEERINALHHTLKLLENERRELCGQLKSPLGLSASEIDWLFRPAAPLNEHEYFAERLGVIHGRC